MNPIFNVFQNFRIFKFFIRISLLFISEISLSQYPHYESINDEKGLPANEVYSLLQDEKGFIWIGCDAGLFRYNGQRFQHYKSNLQKSRSITGLTKSSTNNIYGYNFIGQVFVRRGDSLHFLGKEFKTITNLATDNQGRLIVSHVRGISIYNESLNKWNDLIGFFESSSVVSGTKTAKISSKPFNNSLLFLNPQGFHILKNGGISSVKSSIGSKTSPGSYLIESYNNGFLIFSINQGEYYFLKENSEIQNISTKLVNILSGRKLTRIRHLSDGNLWICTYNGIVKYNSQLDEVKVYYPNMSFSDCLIDSEGNFWFSTLQSGVVFIKDLNQTIWNKDFSKFPNDRITKLVGKGQDIYFSTSTGEIGHLNSSFNSIKLFKTEFIADVQSLDFDQLENSVKFCLNNQIFSIKNDVLSKQKFDFPATKTFCRVDDDLFFGTSSRLSVLKNNSTITLLNTWIRQLKFDKKQGFLFVSSNDGLRILKKNGKKKWEIRSYYLRGKQILSFDFNSKKGILFALAFDGSIYKLDYLNNKIRLLNKVSENAQVKKLVFDKLIYIATNKGVFVLNESENKFQVINKIQGLATDNIQDIYLSGNDLWLATQKGLQRIKLNKLRGLPLSKIYLSNITINKKWIHKPSEIYLEYGDVLSFEPEVISFSSDRTYQIAYRLNNKEWNYFPPNIGKVSIPNIPAGVFQIEVASFDHLGRKSLNSEILKGSVYPPVWGRTWFYALIAIVFVLVVFGISRYIIGNIRKKAMIDTELSNLKLTAIKAQMNPHFIFNALNSIQDLILKGEVENSYTSIITFSNLVRKTLVYSGKDYVELDQEIELIKLYLELEKLRFKNKLFIQLEEPDFENIFIPPMLIQPFIENALLHGLLHKKGDRILKISFFLQNELICIVEDNGIGRRQSRLISERRGSKHESFSGIALKKRFEILNGSSGRKFGFVHEDLTSEEVDCGTRVIITIPFKIKL